MRCVAEATEDNGIRIWYEVAKPKRIWKMELVFLASDRFGHVECTFSYDSPAAIQEFEVPSGWQISIFGPDGQRRATMECIVGPVTLNPELPADEFELPIPPGAIVVDDRQSPSRFALQLADGSTRELSPADMNLQRLIELSSAIRGSRVEGQKINGRESSGTTFRTWLIWSANLIACLFLGSWYFLKRRRK